jgi:glucose-1-phosphate adenylyltransferase
MRSEEVLVIVLAGGVGERLAPLTRDRAKPAVYFGGPYRIIDFVLSNCINSGLRRVYIATQYKSLSLNRHIRQGWSIVSEELGEFVEILPPQKRVGEQWYQGTADAVYQNLYSIVREESRYVVVLAGDHVYKMDYEQMLQQHVEQNADVTIGCLEVPRGEASGFGIVHIDENDRVSSFIEKPKDPPAKPGNPNESLASMGIYVFNTDFLIDQLKRDASDPNSSRDFGKDLIPYLVKHGKAIAHHFSRSCVRSQGQATSNHSRSYWRDVGTLDAYWQANIDLTNVVPELDLYDRDWPIWTFAEVSPPAKFVHDREGRRGKAISSLVSGGCIVSGASVRRSLLFTGVKVHSYAVVENAVILPDVEVERHVNLNNVIIDRGVRIPSGLVVGQDPELDAKRFRRTDNGICLITQPMIDKLGQ